MDLLELPTITLTGTPDEIGTAYGRTCAEAIGRFVGQRLRAAGIYLRERGAPVESLLSVGRRCLAQLKTWDDDGYREFMATAVAAGVDPVELYTAANMTDMRDVLTLGALAAAEDEGCSAVLIPPSHTQGREVIAAQTWDLNPSDIDFVIAVHRRPAAGPATWSITCVGCPSLIGINEHGLAVGNTNIKTRGSRVGIPYMSLLHRGIRCSTLNEAATLIDGARRAAAHNFWVADRHGAVELECAAQQATRRELHDVPLVHTNHCLSSSNQLLEGEPASASSQSRLARLSALMSTHGIDVERLKSAFADRSQGVDSINRRPEDQQGTTTNACIVCVPARRELWACRGPSDRGRWIRLGFA